MMNKIIVILCNLIVQKVTDNYIDEGVILVEATDDVKLTFNCNMFKLKKLRHNIYLLNNVGIKAKIK